jgi:hypothetical protein
MPRLLPKAEFLPRLGVSNTTYHRKQKAGCFPGFVYPTPDAARLPEDEVEILCDGIRAGLSDDEMRAVSQMLVERRALKAEELRAMLSGLAGDSPITRPTNPPQPDRPCAKALPRSPRAPETA